MRLEEGECITSYDVKILFTSVSVDPAIFIIKTSWKKTQNYIRECPFLYSTLLHWWSSALSTHISSSKAGNMNRYMDQQWIPPIIPIMSNLLVKEFEIKVINSAINPPKICLRYVDDAFVIPKEEHKHQFLQHINSIIPHIQFTAEDPNTDGFLLFLDTLVTSGPDNTLLTTVHRKPSHTDQYLQWDSQHNLSAEYNVFNTLTHIARTVCAKPQLVTKGRGTSKRGFTEV